MKQNKSDKLAGERTQMTVEEANQYEANQGNEEALADEARERTSSLPAVRDEPQPTSNHTPGPWMVDDETVNHGPIIIQRNGPLEIAAIYGDSKDQRAANAQLIASAPALLRSNGELKKALNLALEGIDEVWADTHSVHMETIRAAIGKAEALTAQGESKR